MSFRGGRKRGKKQREIISFQPMEGNSIGSARENIYQPRLNMQSPFENSRLNGRGGAACSKKLRGEGGGRGQSPFLGEKRNRVRELEIHERPTKKPAFQKSRKKKRPRVFRRRSWKAPLLLFPRLSPLSWFSLAPSLRRDDRNEMEILLFYVWDKYLH